MSKAKTLGQVAKPKNGDLRVWWIPQVPMKSFRVPVANLVEAALLLETLAKYDLFQLANNIKPDFSNMGGVEVWLDEDWPVWPHGSWITWRDDDGDELLENRSLEDIRKHQPIWEMDEVLKPR